MKALSKRAEAGTKLEEMCFYQPGKSGIIDTVRHGGLIALSYCAGESLQEIRSRYPGAVLMPLDEAYDLVEAVNRARLCTGPKRITKELFQYGLCVLPPRDWQQREGEESFKIMELTCGQLTAIYCRIGDEYFALTEDVNTPHDKIVEMCKAVL